MADESVTHPSYCIVSEVMSYLTPFETDLTASSVFASVGALEARVSALLPVTKAQVNRLCRRDFDYHYEETLTFNGQGDSSILFCLADKGAAPLTVTEAILENDDSWDSTYWVVHSAEGMIQKRAVSGWVEGGTWSEGIKNIRVTATWGYEAVNDIPIELRDAQAKLTGLRVLSQASGSGSGGVKAVSIGSYSVTYGEGGAYSVAIVGWAQEVEEQLAYYARPENFGGGIAD